MDDISIERWQEEKKRRIHYYFREKKRAGERGWKRVGKEGGKRMENRGERVWKKRERNGMMTSWRIYDGDTLTDHLYTSSGN